MYPIPKNIPFGMYQGGCGSRKNNKAAGKKLGKIEYSRPQQRLPYKKNVCRAVLGKITVSYL
jgi:hypothetical protein